MKILHLSTSDIDNGGARAAYRLSQGLQSIGCSSQMLVRAKFSKDRTVIPEKSLLTKLGPPVSGLPLRLYPKHKSDMFSPQWFPDVLAAKVAHINPDVINLHWVCNGYLQIETLPKFKKPLVWTLHDMWPFTGGCVYTQECEKYKVSCGGCPQLNSDRHNDLSHWIWERKVKAWSNLNLTIVATSSWMAECAKASSIFQNTRIETIPLGLDTERYKPIDRSVSRNLLNLPQDKQLILFGALNPTSDPRKGFQLLQPALQKIAQNGWQDRVELVVFGASKPDQETDLGFRTHYLGYLQDDISLAIAYSAADVTIVPSIQEAFGQTASESLSCGTPVVAFSNTGLRDIVDHQRNGYLVTPFEIEELAHGIMWVLEDAERYQKLQYDARAKSLREFAPEVQAHRYLSLYKDISGLNS
ncbi:glycosyltransferase family 4 protein [Pseudanabaena yagii]|uniref:Glycosyltransferase n=1 Tax=Pseudanabaena yagii GIHE-NHR1 TaxID=2722753 RepID=A0ABX1M041_9CYAN|nr:glycosyltransferase family 4 protein [Pseudanabaena yagii]NMF60566.1 glycosyltransferase [Pseudanabaena yagii GIHE-NHR1]